MKEMNVIMMETKVNPNELDRQIVASKEYQIPLSEEDSNYLYDVAGSEQVKEINYLNILPSLHILSILEE